MTRIPSRLLIIAGSDSSGGAGIQTDIATARKFGVYPLTAVSCVTSQNSNGMRMAEPVSDKIFADQIVSCLEDSIPDAIKIGMILSSKQIEILIDIFSRYQCHNVVLDPLMAPTSICLDSTLSKFSRIENSNTSYGTSILEMWRNPSLLSSIAPFVTLATPNIPELKKQLALINSVIPSSGVEKGQKIAYKMLIAKYMEKYGFKNVLLKGGHAENLNLEDILAENLSGELRFTSFPHVRIDTPNTHGTGCTLSSAIASSLALGFGIRDAVKQGTDFIFKTLNKNKDISFYPDGHGPTII